MLVLYSISHECDRVNALLMAYCFEVELATKKLSCDDLQPALKRGEVGFVFVSI